MGKISYSEIKKYIEIESKSGCELITCQDEYINTHQKIRIMCKCGNEFETSYHIFTRKINPTQQCKQCGLKNGIKKRTLPLKKFQEEISKKFNNEFEIVGEFKNRSTHTKFKHKICGYEWLTTPTNFLRDSGCPKCNKKRRNITTESFKKEVCELTNGEYKLVGKYTKAINKTLFKHNICNRIYETTPHEFLSGSRCPMCWNESKLGKFQKDSQAFKKEVYEKYGDEYIVISDYTGARIKLKIEHKICNNTYFVTPDNILRGKKCPYCSNKTPYDTESFKVKITKIYPDEYTILGEYKTMHSKILVKHNKCGYEWEIEANSLLRCEGSCPKCVQSIGERAIEKFLEKRKIKYKIQYKITGCKDRSLLPFDFAIFSEDNNLKLIIEYDGVQHFRPVDIFGGEDGYIDRQKKDGIKTNYCFERKIPLLRIPYWEKNNIDGILDKELKKYFD